MYNSNARRAKRNSRPQRGSLADGNWRVKPVGGGGGGEDDDRSRLESPASEIDHQPLSFSSLQEAPSSPRGSGNPRSSRWAPRDRLDACSAESSDVDRSEPELPSSSNREERKLAVDDVVTLRSDERVGGDVAANGREAREGESKAREASGDVDDVVSKLEEMRLGMEEPELEEEQLKSNDQLQEDELLAMKEIYGDNVFILDRRQDLRFFEIYIDVEVAGEIKVIARLNSSNDLAVVSGNSDGFSYSFKVQHLHPIVLTCLFPKSYPSHVPPCFNISVQWLAPTKISSLCSMLDSIWQEQPGQEVVYPWVEWLQRSSLSYLGFDEKLDLGPYGIRGTGDKRAISGIVSPDVDIPLIRSYNDDKCHENFLKNLHECCICFTEYAGTEFIKLPCQHFFCWKCMKTCSDLHVKEGTVYKLHCLASKCGGMVPPSVLKRLLGDEEYEHWESLMLQKSLESMSDVAYCPRCETPCIEDEDQHAQCSKCFFSFCTLCRERRHVGVECMKPEIKLRILQVILASRPRVNMQHSSSLTTLLGLCDAGKDENSYKEVGKRVARAFLDERQSSSQLKDEQKRWERELINELLSVKEINKIAKQCPSCKMAISRTEGCNKMVCENCGQYFCYSCNKAIDGYDHFRDGTCELFPEQEIRQWEERMNPRQLVGQVQAELFANHGQTCPNCRQFNAKIGNNNHIFCWACQTHYCYLCKKIVRRASEHYGPKGCKQHTAG